MQSTSTAAPTPTGASPHYPHVQRSTVDNQINDAIAMPQYIHQRGANLCGPAAFWYSLAEQRPDEYRRVITEIYTHGRSRLGGLLLEPSEKAKRYDVSTAAHYGKTPLREVDWIAFSALKRGYDDPHSLMEPLLGATMAMTLAGWLRDAGCQAVGNETRWLYPQEGIHRLYKAHLAYVTGHTVVLLIDGELLWAAGYDGKENYPGPGVFNSPNSIANHFVVMTSDIKVGSMDTSTGQVRNLRSLNAPTVNRIEKTYQAAQVVETPHTHTGKHRVAAESDDVIDMTVYSWGNTGHTVHARKTGQMPRLYYFLRHYHGHVAAKWPQP